MKTLAWLGASFALYLVLFAAALGSAMGGDESSSSVVVGGFPPGVDVGLDPEQVRNVTISLTVADELKAPPLAVLAMTVSGLGESEFRVVPNARGSGYCGVFQAHPDNIACDDTRQQATSFQLGGKGFQAGGAIHLARTQPNLTPGTIATRVEASGQPGSFYDKFLSQAEVIVAAWRSGSTVVQPGSSVRERIIAEAEKTLSIHTGYYRYSQPGALTDDPTPPPPARTDCSQWVRAVYLAAGAPDPGVNTQDQILQGRQTGDPKPGDLLFSADGGHVEIYVGPNKTYGHGSPPIDEGRVSDYPGGFFVTYPGLG